MRRRKSINVYQKVWHELNREPQTIHQISQRTNINWETVKKSITVLNSIKLLNYYEINGKKKYASFKLKKQKDEIKSPLEMKKKLMVEKLFGSGNKCVCGRTGDFGSIVLFKEYMVCGWCGTISLHQPKLKSGDEPQTA